jgi:hypothetical protein
MQRLLRSGRQPYRVTEGLPVIQSQARTEKDKEELGQTAASIQWFGGGCRSFGRFNELRNKSRKEARPVGSWSSGDCQGGEKAVGEVRAQAVKVAG